MKTVYLLTGLPGTGKTTLVRKAVAEVGKSAGGFYSEEIRQSGARQGFEIVTLDGHNAVLAHVNIKSQHRVGKYGVDVESLDKVGVAAVRQAIRDSSLIVIDEIGKMELFSTAFKEAVLDAIASGKKMLGTIMLAPHPFADSIKKRPEVELFELTRANRQASLDRLLEWAKA